MISIVGIGNGASAIAEKFNSTSNYDVYQMSSSVARSSKRKYKLKTYANPEDYEKNIPDLTKFFTDINDHVQVFVVGSSFSSNYVLGILEQIKNKKIEVFYIKPDTELLTGMPRLVEQAVFGVLQEYARSGLLSSVTLISNLKVEEVVGQVPIKTYFDTINNSIFSTVHYYNYFTHADPEIGVISKPNDINRIRTIGILNPKTLEEKWLFDLDNSRDMSYYICIRDEALETDGGLHRRLVDILKNKPKNAFKHISYAIYGTEHKQDFGFVVANTNATQKQKNHLTSSLNGDTLEG